MLYIVSPKSLDGLVKAHVGVLLRVTLGADTGFPSLIADYFEDEYRGVIAFGTLRWEEMSVPAWREKHFKDILGRSVVPNGTAGQPGFYLFIDGYPSHYEPEHTLKGPLEAYFFKLRLEGAPNLPPPAKFPSWERTILNNMEKIIGSTLAGIPIQVAAERAPKPKPRLHAPPKPPPGAAKPTTLKKPDSYTVLGVPQDSTKEVVDKVFRLKSRGCHPDGYGGLPEAAIAMATDEFKRLTNARDDIYKKKGWT